jgi:RNA polymerase sigma-70 factor (ECF subfamily)
MMNEEEHILKILAGDSSAYRFLVERYQTGLIIYCERLVHDRQIAEDLAQESFIKAYQNLLKFDSKKARFSTWLYRIASNKAIDYLRTTKHKVDVKDIEALADKAAEPALLDDEIIAIREAVDTLEPPVVSEIIKAYYWQGKSYQTIADEFNLPINTVGTWMRRAKVHLKEKLS